MIRNAKLVVEMFIFLYCLAALYDKKLKFNIHLVVLVILDLFLLTGINEYGFPECFLTFPYVAMFLYALIYYRENVKLTLVNCLLAVAIVSILQLILYLPVFYIFIEKNGVETKYELMINAGCLVLVMFGTRQVGLKALSDFLMKRNKLLAAIAVLILFTLGKNLYQVRHVGEMAGKDYIQMLYFFLLLFFTINEWQKAKVEVEKKKVQIEMNTLYYDAYDELLTLVRERQHDMKNNINAILSMIYVYDNYEDLAREQKKYCDQIIEDNRKSKLLLSKINPLIAGFLYWKIQEAEEKGIEIEFENVVEQQRKYEHEYEIVEMLGILLDNAMEALVKDDEVKKIIHIHFMETKEKMEISVANSSDIHDFEKVSEFFKKGYSSKGKGHGIGLYKLKKMVKKRGGDISVMFEQEEDINFLKFCIEIAT